MSVQLGIDFRLKGDFNRSLHFFQIAETLRKNLYENRGKAHFLLEFARLEKDLGHLDESLKKITESLRLLEKLRASIGGSGYRTSFFAAVHEYYEFYIDLLMELHQRNPTGGYDIQAFQASEQARARTLLELLNESRIDIRKGVSTPLAQEQDGLSQRIRDKTAAVLTLLQEGKSKQLVSDLEQEIETLTDQYETVTAKIRAQSPVYAALTEPKPLELKEIQQRVLDSDTLLLEFFLGRERSYVWAVSGDSIWSYPLPKQSEIEALVRQAYQTLAKPTKTTSPKGASPNNPLTDLSRLLLGQMAGELGTKRLVIVADGALQSLPFGCLPIPAAGPGKTGSQRDRCLLAEHEIVNLPSASTLALLRSENRPPAKTAKTVAVFADPVFEASDERVQQTTQARQNPPAKPSEPETESLFPDPLRDLELTGDSQQKVVIPRLRFTRQETREILQTVSATELTKQALDFEATLEQATQTDLSQFRVVHFATHGVFNSKQPALSGIVLSLVKPDGSRQNGFLGLQEIFKLKLQADLVVLSSCQSGLGKAVAGEGLVGLTRGFMYAGTPRVVTSLWSVNDQATAELMRLFYQNYLGPKQLPPAAALRQAQLTMAKDKRWAHPFFWGAFTIQGEYR